MDMNNELNTKQVKSSKIVNKSKSPSEHDYFVDFAIENTVGISVKELSDILQVEQVKGLGPQKFKLVYKAGHRAGDILNNPQLFKISGKRGQELQRALAEIAEKDNLPFVVRAKRYIFQAHKFKASILSYWHPQYPQTVFESNYPTPLLFARGSLDVLTADKTFACVGSRKIRSPYTELAKMFVEIATLRGVTVVAGFALGADTIGHKTSVEMGGSTICVMAGGLDRPFPPENKHLWEDFLENKKVVFVSEAPFGARALGLTLRKRNKLIVAFSRGVLICQSAEKGGTMNAFRFAKELHRRIATFVDDGKDDTSGNKLISLDPKALATIFENTRLDSNSWERWLHQLSYSI